MNIMRIKGTIAGFNVLDYVELEGVAPQWVLGVSGEMPDDAVERVTSEYRRRLETVYPHVVSEPGVVEGYSLHSGEREERLETRVVIHKISDFPGRMRVSIPYDRGAEIDKSRKQDYTVSYIIDDNARLSDQDAHL
jgi:hypothetical protein